MTRTEDDVVYSLDDWMRATVVIEHVDGRREYARFGGAGLAMAIRALEKGYAWGGVVGHHDPR